MTQAKELATTSTTELAPAKGVSPLVQMLATGQYTPEQVSQMIDLQAKYDAQEAKKAYSMALARFRELAPTLKQDRHVHFKTQKGVTDYRHTSLGYAMSEVNPLLGQCGLNLSWDTGQNNDNVTVTAILMHEFGHQETVSLTAPIDLSGNKNPIQALKSTITYLQRTTAFAILGLASEHDDDGQSAAQPPAEIITEDQWADLKSLVEETGGNVNAWVNWISKRYPSNGDYAAIPAAHMDQMIAQINNAAKKREAAQ